MRTSYTALNFLLSISRDFAKKAPRAIIGEPTIEASKRHVLAKDTSVVLFGWAGAKEKHLAKHADMYNDRGFKTLSFTAAFDGRHPLYLKDGRDLSGLLPKIEKLMINPPQRLLIHAYSMNGVFTLCTLLYQNGFTDILKRVDGLAMDSCPVYFKEVSAYTLVLDSIFTELTKTMSPFQKKVATAYKNYLGVVMFLAHVRAKLLHVVFNKPLTQIDAYTFLKTHPDMPNNQAYFFSDNDVICKADMIMEFIESQLANGRDVDYHNFGSAEHVAHLRADPTGYQSLLDGYLDKIAIKRGLLTSK